ncbi:hypothetical protein, conserved [Babesia ovata]|uniref:Uncharacterized protein n=1 Tax=Babesia ovata TaxID=189622 RepID=A0A2H6KG97_9APIC|nr:uncharacterized protein BOVATA_035080 [Babesia ovata]GBE62015.1 hypothetical protein, conserved [Babesia ovata]
MEQSRASIIRSLESEDRYVYELHKRRHRPSTSYPSTDYENDTRISLELDAVRTVRSILQLKDAGEMGYPLKPFLPPYGATHDCSCHTNTSDPCNSVLCTRINLRSPPFFPVKGMGSPDVALGHCEVSVNIPCLGDTPVNDNKPMTHPDARVPKATVGGIPANLASSERSVAQRDDGESSEFSKNTGSIEPKFVNGGKSHVEQDVRTLLTADTLPKGPSQPEDEPPTSNVPGQDASEDKDPISIVTSPNDTETSDVTAERPIEISSPDVGTGTRVEDDSDSISAAEAVHEYQHSDTDDVYTDVKPLQAADDTPEFSSQSSDSPSAREAVRGSSVDSSPIRSPRHAPCDTALQDAPISKQSSLDMCDDTAAVIDHDAHVEASPDTVSATPPTCLRTGTLDTTRSISKGDTVEASEPDIVSSRTESNTFHSETDGGSVLDSEQDGVSDVENSIDSVDIDKCDEGATASITPDDEATLTKLVNRAEDSGLGSPTPCSASSVSVGETKTADSIAASTSPKLQSAMTSVDSPPLSSGRLGSDATLAAPSTPASVDSYIQSDVASGRASARSVVNSSHASSPRLEVPEHQQVVDMAEDTLYTTESTITEEATTSDTLTTVAAPVPMQDIKDGDSSADEVEATPAASSVVTSRSISVSADDGVQVDSSVEEPSNQVSRTPTDIRTSETDEQESDLQLPITSQSSSHLGDEVVSEPLASSPHVATVEDVVQLPTESVEIIQPSADTVDNDAVETYNETVEYISQPSTDTVEADDVLASTDTLNESVTETSTCTVEDVQPPEETVEADVILPSVTTVDVEVTETTESIVEERTDVVEDATASSTDNNVDVIEPPIGPVEVDSNQQHTEDVEDSVIETSAEAVEGDANESSTETAEEFVQPPIDIVNVDVVQPIETANENVIDAPADNVDDNIIDCIENVAQQPQDTANVNVLQPSTENAGDGTPRSADTVGDNVAEIPAETVDGCFRESPTETEDADDVRACDDTVEDSVTDIVENATEALADTSEVVQSSTDTVKDDIQHPIESVDENGDETSADTVQEGVIQPTETMDAENTQPHTDATEARDILVSTVTGESHTNETISEEVAECSYAETCNDVSQAVDNMRTQRVGDFALPAIHTITLSRMASVISQKSVETPEASVLEKQTPREALNDLRLPDLGLSSARSDTVNADAPLPQSPSATYTSLALNYDNIRALSSRFSSLAPGESSVPAAESPISYRREDTLSNMESSPSVIANDAADIGFSNISAEDSDSQPVDASLENSPIRVPHEVESQNIEPESKDTSSLLGGVDERNGDENSSPNMTKQSSEDAADVAEGIKDNVQSHPASEVSDNDVEQSKRVPLAQDCETPHAVDVDSVVSTNSDDQKVDVTEDTHPSEGNTVVDSAMEAVNISDSPAEATSPRSVVSERCTEEVESVNCEEATTVSEECPAVTDDSPSSALSQELTNTDAVTTDEPADALNDHEDPLVPSSDSADVRVSEAEEKELKPEEGGSLTTMNISPDTEPPSSNLQTDELTTSNAEPNETAAQSEASDAENVDTKEACDNIPSAVVSAESSHPTPRSEDSLVTDARIQSESEASASPLPSEPTPVSESVGDVGREPDISVQSTASYCDINGNIRRSLSNGSESAAGDNGTVTTHDQDVASTDAVQAVSADVNTPSVPGELVGHEPIAETSSEIAASNSAARSRSPSPTSGVVQEELSEAARLSNGEDAVDDAAILSSVISESESVASQLISESPRSDATPQLESDYVTDNATSYSDDSPFSDESSGGRSLQDSPRVEGEGNVALGKPKKAKANVKVGDASDVSADLSSEDSAGYHTDALVTDEEDASRQLSASFCSARRQSRR